VSVGLQAGADRLAFPGIVRIVDRDASLKGTDRGLATGVQGRRIGDLVPLLHIARIEVDDKRRARAKACDDDAVLRRPRSGTSLLTCY
jgi:hypothetical protein